MLGLARGSTEDGVSSGRSAGFSMWFDLCSRVTPEKGRSLGSRETQGREEWPWILAKISRLTKLLRCL